MRWLLAVLAVAFVVAVLELTTAEAKPVVYDLDAPADQLYAKWKKANPKAARKINHTKALKNLQTNVKVAKKLNAKKKKGNIKFSVNNLAVYSKAEFKKKFLNGVKVPRNWRKGSKKHSLPVKRFAQALPTHIDWSRKGYASPVQFQGKCGTCWAFSATGAIEGQLARKGYGVKNLSEQWFLECTGHRNCSRGGWMSHAFDAVTPTRKDAFKGGIPEEKHYPYTAGENGVWGQCKGFSSGQLFTVSGWKSFPKDADTIAAFVAKNGPVAATINMAAFQNYANGIIETSLCPSKEANHAVLIVGFGTTNLNPGPNNQGAKGTPVPYWIVKNSWSDQWGSAGYFYVKRGNDNACGIIENVMVPVIN
jgi:cysteine peptidase B